MRLLLIGVKRYKNITGEWPGSLDGIKELTSQENFVDPTNGGSFVYKLTEDSFTLYSKGKNNIDENGLREQNIYKEGDIFDYDIGKICMSKRYIHQQLRGIEIL